MSGFTYLLAGLSAGFVLRLIWRRTKSPNRPLLTCFLDTLFEIPAILKIGPFGQAPEIEAIVQDAVKQSKLSDFGTKDMSFVEKYQVSRRVGIQKTGAKYSPVGSFLVKENMTKRVISRLKFIDYLKRHPSINNIQLKPPVFVIGFPRTGTTFLHEMLGLHEGVRSHYTWEQIDPIPGTDDESIEAQTKDRVKRYDANKPMFDFTFKHLIGDKLQHIHRIAYDEPEECTIPCAFELPWALAELPLMVVAADEVIPLGAGEAFNLYRKYLQLLAWQTGDRRNADFTWMLKCPFHLPYLEELFKAFPGATVVWTHRDPAECIASACSLYQTIMHMGMEEYSINPNDIGNAVVNYTKNCLAKAQETIDKHQDKVKMVHIRYLDTIKDSKGLCRRVMEEAGIPFSSQYESKLDEYLKNSAEQRKKLKEKKQSAVVHDYKPEDFGLTAAKIREDFKDYISQYDLLDKKTK